MLEIAFTAPLKDHQNFLGKGGGSVDDYGNQKGGVAI